MDWVIYVHHFQAIEAGTNPIVAEPSTRFLFTNKQQAGGIGQPGEGPLKRKGRHAHWSQRVSEVEHLEGSSGVSDVAV